jgi:aminoglycoside phosphotransferase (APT) family kinase protein
MSTDASSVADDGIDADRLARWLSDVDGTARPSVAVHRLAGGHSSGAWRVDVVRGGEPRSLVLKAPGEPSMVYQRDACREARIIDALNRMGAPVPAIVAVDSGTRATGRPCFLMEYVAGRVVSDEAPGGYHGDGWFRDAETATQRAIWESFHDALAALHRADAAMVPDASHGPRGALDVLDYWRSALLDALPADAAPRQLDLIDWLRDNLPPGGEPPAVCMGDSRLANCLIDGTDVRALVDFEVAYLGNPAADVGYSLFFDGLQRGHSDRPIASLPSADETWDRWSRATGRATDDRDYWTAFGATILCVTASRAMVQWGVPAESIESANLVVSQWETAVERASR